MRLTQQQVLSLFQGVHIVHVACLMYRLRCIAHRMLNFGFEPFVNTYQPRELVLLSCIMPARAGEAILREAYAMGDEAVCAFIDQHCPDVLELARG